MRGGMNLFRARVIRYIPVSILAEYRANISETVSLRFEVPFLLSSQQRYTIGHSIRLWRGTACGHSQDINGRVDDECSLRSTTAGGIHKRRWVRPSGEIGYASSIVCVLARSAFDEWQANEIYVNLGERVRGLRRYVTVTLPCAFAVATQMPTSIALVISLPPAPT